MSCDVGRLTYVTFSNPSVALPTSKFILQPFFRFSYVTVHSPTFPSLHLRQSSFSNPSFASLTSLALHLRHLASRPCISPTLITKFSQNIVADTDKNKALTASHKFSSSFLSIVKSHSLKIPANVLEEVRAGSCLKLFLIDCKSRLCSIKVIKFWQLIWKFQNSTKFSPRVLNMKKTVCIVLSLN